MWYLWSVIIYFCQSFSTFFKSSKGKPRKRGNNKDGKCYEGDKGYINIVRQFTELFSKNFAV